MTECRSAATATERMQIWLKQNGYGDGLGHREQHADGDREITWGESTFFAYQLDRQLMAAVPSLVAGHCVWVKFQRSWWPGQLWLPSYFLHERRKVKSYQDEGVVKVRMLLHPLCKTPSRILL